MGFWGKLGSLGALGGGAVLTATGYGAPAGMALMGAGAMGAKHEWEDIPQQQSQMRLEAEKARYAPYTGDKPGTVDPTSGVGAMLQGAVTGASIGQGLKSAAPPTTDTGNLIGSATPASGPTLGLNTDLGYGSPQMQSMTGPLGMNTNLGGSSLSAAPNANVSPDYAGNPLDRSWLNMIKKQQLPNFYS